MQSRVWRDYKSHWAYEQNLPLAKRPQVVPDDFCRLPAIVGDHCFEAIERVAMTISLMYHPKSLVTPPFRFSRIIKYFLDALRKCIFVSDRIRPAGATVYHCFLQSTHCGCDNGNPARHRLDR